jgi:hypothetical protein
MLYYNLSSTQRDAEYKDCDICLDTSRMYLEVNESSMSFMLCMVANIADIYQGPL